LLQSGGVSAAAAGTMAAAASGANILGNLIGGRLLQRHVPSQKVLTIGFAAMAVGATVVFATPATTPVAIKLAAVLLFSGVGGMIPGSLFSLAVKAAPSDDTASTALGWTTQMSMLGQFAMPPLVASLATAHGGWGLSWVVTGGLCLVGIALVTVRHQATRINAPNPH
jgi:CP family cyanate transporter-like MFS transporter